MAAAKELIHTQRLKDYLGVSDLNQHLKLTKDLSFHWANWDQTCLVQRSYCQNFNRNIHLVRMSQSLQELKAKQIWLRNKVKIIKTDLFSLYESYLDSRLRVTWFDRKEEILFSFGGEQGPYFTLTSMKWLDKDIYAQFVMRKILLETYSLRSFRLNATIPVFFKTNNDFQANKDSVKIHQLSETGIILKITDKNILNKIKNSTMLELKIPIKPYAGIAALKPDDIFKKINEHELSMEEDALGFRLESKILNFYENLNNTKRASDEVFFIFARYENLFPEGHCVGMKNIFTPLVEKAKSHFMLELYSLGKARK